MDDRRSNLIGDCSNLIEETFLTDFTRGTGLTKSASLSKAMSFSKCSVLFFCNLLIFSLNSEGIFGRPSSSLVSSLSFTGEIGRLNLTRFDASSSAIACPFLNCNLSLSVNRELFRIVAAAINVSLCVSSSIAMSISIVRPLAESKPINAAV